MRTRSVLTSTALLGAIGLATTGCLSTNTGGGGGGSAGGSGGAGKTTISIMYAFGGGSSTAFQKDVKEWADSQGLTINFIQSDSFEQLISTKVASGDLPDIAVYPQPGILQKYAKQGKVAPLDTQIDVKKLESDIIPGFLLPATVDGVVYGAPISMNVKGLWWYDKANWAAKGYTVPKTQDELVALFDKIKGTGATPLCYGMESGSATGWPGTDWIENYVLQTSGPDVYDKWISHEVTFDSPEIRKAFDVYNKLVMTPGYTYGTAKGAASIPFGKAFQPMFGSQAKCWTGMQGNFIASQDFFGEAVMAKLDSTVGVFETPTVNGEHPLEVGGDFAAAFTKDDANVKKVMNFITNDPTFGKNWAQNGQFMSPHKSFDGTNYPNQMLRDIAKIAAGASVARFDGSDAMPAAVGSKSFWTGMVDYTTGAKNLDQVLKAIDDSWPAS